MKTICNKCYVLNHQYAVGANCPDCDLTEDGKEFKGILLDISYLDFTSSEGLTLHRHPVHTTLFMEKEFCIPKSLLISKAPTKTIGAEYIEDIPYFIPVYPIIWDDVPKNPHYHSLLHYLQAASGKIRHYNETNRLVSGYATNIEEVKKLIFKQ